MFSFKEIKDVSDFSGKKIIVRVDFNVPIAGGRIIDDFRIRKTLPTIEFLSKKGAKLIIISHIEGKEEDSLKPVFKYLKDKLDITFADSIHEAGDIVPKLQNGEVLLVENLRKDPREKKNDETFSREIASLGDVYINEAFSASHRSHSSIVGVPKLLPSYAGFLFSEEVLNLSKALSPERPFLFILGGEKFKTKLPLIEKYLKIADHLFIGGALANNFFKCMGYEIGRSKFSGEGCDLTGFSLGEKVFLPSDVIVTAPDGKITTKKPTEVLTDDLIEDSGEETLSKLEPFIEKAKLIVWNGPLGSYEKGFDEITTKLAELIAGSNAFSIVGGGDTSATLSKKFAGEFDFTSTGGGAMLHFLQDGDLPGIEALKLKDL